MTTPRIIARDDLEPFCCTGQCSQGRTCPKRARPESDDDEDDYGAGIFRAVGLSLLITAMAFMIGLGLFHVVRWALT